LPPFQAFEAWGIDFVGPLEKTNRGNKYLVTAIDYCTGWPIAIALPSRSESAAVLMIRNIIPDRALPSYIIFDNGSEFTSTAFTTLLARLNITHIKTAPYHPHTKGKVERFHQTLTKALRSLIAPDG